MEAAAAAGGGRRHLPQFFSFLSAIVPLRSKKNWYTDRNLEGAAGMKGMQRNCTGTGKPLRAGYLHH